MKKIVNLKTLLFIGTSIALGGLITILMDQNNRLYGWFITSLVLGLSFFALFLLFKKAGSTRLLGWMMAAAFFLRLGLGITLMKALPVVGYDTEQQKAGYVFYDLFRREWQAMDIARSDKPILSVFSKKYATDQYGGYLGLSVFVYRVLSGGDYRPHLMLILSALAAAMGVSFLWMILSRLKTGTGSWHKFAGWWYVLYPQAVLLGASQMREPFLITFVTIVFWAAIEWQRSGLKTTWAWMLTGLAGMLLLSPGVALLSLIILAVWIWLDRSKKNITWWIFPVVLVIIIIATLLMAYGLARQEHFSKDSPIEIILNWFRNSAAWDANLTQEASGRLEFIFKYIPEWSQLPFIIAYGILQPVLPATIMDTSVWIWRLITTYLALGWYLLLLLIVYGSVSAFFEQDRAVRNKMLWLTVVIWSWIIICSTRAGGDMWDNPRYRAIILVFLVIFAAWAWEHARINKFVWLKRTILVEGIFLLFFMQWYAARYYRIFGKMPFFTMVGVILGLSLLVIVGGLIKDRVLANHQKSIPEEIK